MRPRARRSLTSSSSSAETGFLMRPAASAAEAAAMELGWVLWTGKLRKMRATLPDLSSMIRSITSCASAHMGQERSVYSTRKTLAVSRPRTWSEMNPLCSLPAMGREAS